MFSFFDAFYRIMLNNGICAHFINFSNNNQKSGKLGAKIIHKICEIVLITS